MPFDKLLALIIKMRIAQDHGDANVKDLEKKVDAQLIKYQQQNIIES